MTIGEFVDSLVHDIERAGLEDIVIVGHSLGGMTLAGVVTKLGAARVREMIFAAAFLPSQGTSIWRAHRGYLRRSPGALQREACDVKCRNGWRDSRT